VKRTPRLLTDTPLHVAPEYLGQPLASPIRRALALAVDYVILLLPMVAVAWFAAALSLRVTDPPAYGALRSLLLDSKSTDHTAALVAVAPLLARLEAPGLPAEAVMAVEQKKPDELARALKGYQFQFNLSIGPEQEHQEQPVPPKTIRLDVERLIPRPLRALAMLGVAALYFTFFHASRRGQTPGKRLLGIRVVHLGGERLAFLESLERFAGYVEIPATLGFGLLSLWRDPNRRLPHDRVVHTAVLRRRAN
jgi:RDD family